MANTFKIIIKIILILLALLLAYYFILLKPKLELPNALLKTEKVLSQYHANLLQNKIAYVGLTKLNSNSANISAEKSHLISTLQQTNKEGIELTKKKQELPKIDSELTRQFPKLLEKHKQILEEQNQILDELLQLKTFEEGLELIRSNRSVEMLTRQTNLILEYEFWLDKINQKQSELNISRE